MCFVEDNCGKSWEKRNVVRKKKVGKVGLNFGIKIRNLVEVTGCTRLRKINRNLEIVIHQLQMPRYM